MMRKTARHLALPGWLAALCAALAGGAGYAAIDEPASPARPQGEVTITAYYGGQARATQERTVPFQAGDTAMSATLRALRVETNSEKTFVKSIEGVANDDSRKDYWLYFVNGESMHVGASETRLKAGDRVFWFLRRQSSATHEKHGAGW